MNRWYTTFDAMLHRFAALGFAMAMWALAIFLIAQAVRLLLFIFSTPLGPDYNQS